MADVSVRPAQPEDAERIARVQLATWREAYAALLPPQALDVPEVEVAAVWLAAVEAPPTPAHRVLVAMDAHELVGFAVGQPLEGDSTVELATLLVEPRWGRRGHGSRLLAATVDLWRADGATRAVTWAFEADYVSTRFLETAGWAFDGLGRGLDTGAQVVTQRRLHVDLTQAPGV